VCVRLIGLAVVVATALVGAGPVGARADAYPGFWSAAWTDSRGDAGAAPDITILQLGANDHGDVLMRVYAPTGSNGSSNLLQVFIKRAQRSTDGDPTLEGANMQLTYSYHDRKMTAVVWDGATHKWYPSVWYSTPLDQRLNPIYVTPTSTSFILPNSMFSTSESNGKIGVFFRLGTTAKYDEAPNRGFHEYNVQPLALTEAAFATAGKRAGQQLRLSVAVKRSDTGGYLTAGEVTCIATAGSHRIPGATLGFATSGVPLARCGWKLPAALKGKRVHASITVAFAGRLITHSTTFVLR
jgi:hypothetical protein